MIVAIGCGLGLAALMARGHVPDLIISPKHLSDTRVFQKVYPAGSDGGVHGGFDVWGGALGWPSSTDDLNYFQSIRNFLRYAGWDSGNIDAYCKCLSEDVSVSESLTPYIDTKYMKRKFVSDISRIKKVDGIALSINLTESGVDVLYENKGLKNIVKSTKVYLCCGHLQTMSLLERSGLFSKSKSAFFEDTKIGLVGRVMFTKKLDNTYFNRIYINGLRHRRIFKNDTNTAAFYLIPSIHGLTFSQIVKMKKAVGGDYRAFFNLLSRPLQFFSTILKIAVSEYFTKSSDSFFIWGMMRPGAQEEIDAYLESNPWNIDNVESQVEVFDDFDDKLENAFHLRSSSMDYVNFNDDGVAMLKADSRVYLSSLAIVGDESCRNPGVFLF